MASLNRTILHISSAVLFAVFAYLLRKLIKFVQSKRRVNGKNPAAVVAGENAVETRGLLAEDKVHTLCQKEEPASEAKIKMVQAGESGQISGFTRSEKNHVIVSGGTDAVVKLGETVEVIERYIPEGESGQTCDDSGGSKENYLVVSGGTDAVVKTEEVAATMTNIPARIHQS